MKSELASSTLLESFERYGGASKGSSDSISGDTEVIFFVSFVISITVS